MSWSGADGRESLTLSDLQEWFVAMGLEVEGEDKVSVAEQLRDGVLLCQLINRIKSNSVEVVSLVLSCLHSRICTVSETYMYMYMYM